MEKILEALGVSKSFGPVQALKNVDFTLKKREIVGLVGDNAAGKSTLLKSMYGIYQPDAGKIRLFGREVRFKSPLEARKSGLEMVFQDFNLCPDLSAYENAFLGREISRLNVLNKKEMKTLADRIVKEEGFDLETDRRIETLSGGQQQLAAILRVLLFEARIMFLDEPTANLSASASMKIVKRLKKLKNEREAGMIYVSHKLPEVISASDRIVVLRRGEVVGELKSEEATVDKLIEMIMGGERF